MTHTIKKKMSHWVIGPHLCLEYLPLAYSWSQTGPGAAETCQAWQCPNQSWNQPRSPFCVSSKHLWLTYLKCEETKIMLIFKYLPFLTINQMYKYLQKSWKYRKIWIKKKVRTEWMYVTDFPLSAGRVVSSCLLSCMFFKSGIHILTIISYHKNYFSTMTSTLLKKNWKHTCD